eukprot:TRINITY_DN2246_c0_g1_i1.p1 TRINITY_DN2246_c0_g1~~TRINITY_DN2246_c0_g1_i1.p1  ORF type:complete len:373 (-),score=81.14 TRINITY_DN2246_c0_g1_i1:12-1013(-)
MLGNPGVFCVDERASIILNKLGLKEMVHRQFSEEHIGRLEVEFGSKWLVNWMINCFESEGVHIFISHEDVVFSVAAVLLGVPPKDLIWPDYCSYLELDITSSNIKIQYHNIEACIERPLLGITEENVINLAKKLVSFHLNLSSKSYKFSLAGGAFKSIFTGSEVYDLDIWPHSDDDRESIINHLKTSKHLKFHKKGEFNDLFSMNDGITIEVTRKVGSGEYIISTFDIGLSAIAAEYNGKSWKAIIHPLAIESVKSQSIQLLLPLVNVPYCLTTLERAIRYSKELGFAFTQGEEEIVKLFLNQPLAIRHEWVQNWKRTTRIEECDYDKGAFFN